MPSNPNKLSKTKTKLVLYLSTFPQPSETFLVSKFFGLLERGWDVHILCHRINKEAWQQFPALCHHPQALARVHCTWPTQPRWLATILFLPALINCLIRAPRKAWGYLRKGWTRFGLIVFRHFYLDAALIALKPDILHFEFGTLAIGKTYLKEHLNLKMSVSFRGYDLNYNGLDQPDYYKKVWEALDGAHFLGQDLWHRAQRRGAPIELPRFFIPPALDPSIFPYESTHRNGSLGSRDQPLRILSVGRLHWKKGYEFNLQTIRLLLDQGYFCEYHIIGGGDYEAPLYFARHQLDLEDVVIFCGGLSHEQVIESLKWADVLLHGAVSEGFCNAVLEAQAMGVPVVCTDADGLSENIENGVTGFVVPRRDPAAMAEKIATLARDGDLRRQMGAAGRKRFETYFRMDQQLDAFEAFYDQL